MSRKSSKKDAQVPIDIMRKYHINRMQVNVLTEEAKEYLQMFVDRGKKK